MRHSILERSFGTSDRIQESKARDESRKLGVPSYPWSEALI
jgi:hypothetical protein